MRQQSDPLGGKKKRLLAVEAVEAVEAPPREEQHAAARGGTDRV